MAAGVVFVAGGLGLALLLGMLFPEVEAVPAPPPGPDLTLTVAIRLGVGYVLAWLYAAARFRLRSTLRTALRIGLAVWFLLYIPYAWVQVSLELLPRRPAAAIVAWGFFECLFAAFMAGVVHQRLKPEYARY